MVNTQNHSAVTEASKDDKTLPSRLRVPGEFVEVHLPPGALTFDAVYNTVSHVVVLPFLAIIFSGDSPPLLLPVAELFSDIYVCEILFAVTSSVSVLGGFRDWCLCCDVRISSSWFVVKYKDLFLTDSSCTRRPSDGNNRPVNLSHLVSAIVEVESHDGTKVPVILAYDKRFRDPVKGYVSCLSLSLCLLSSTLLSSSATPCYCAATEHTDIL